MDDLALLSATLGPQGQLPASNLGDAYRQGLAKALLAYGAGQRQPADPSALAEAIRVYGISQSTQATAPDPSQPPTGIRAPGQEALTPDIEQGADAPSDISSPAPPPPASLALVADGAPVGAGPEADPIDGSIQSSSVDERPEPEDSGAEILASDGRVYPWVTDFRNRHLADAVKLAQIIGHGVTPDEILAVSGNEFNWGRDPKAAQYGNYFGLHSKGTDPSGFFPGQTGYLPTDQDGPLATFDPVSGFFNSGLRFASRMKNHAGKADLSDPMTFFSLAHSLGWGTKNKKYLPQVYGAYQTIRRSAAAMENRS